MVTQVHMYDRNYQSHIIHTNDFVLCKQADDYFVVQIAVTCFVFFDCCIVNKLVIITKSKK